MHPTYRASRHVIAAAALVLLLPAGCADDPAQPREEAVADVRVSAPVSQLAVGDAPVRFAATPMSSGGRPLGGREVLWTSTNAAVATVASDGTVTPRSVGAAEIRATSAGRTGSVVITVALPAGAYLRITPTGPLAADAGTFVQFGADVFAASGTPLPPLPATWETSDSSIAEVTEGGRVRAVRYGAALVTARAGGLVATAALQVRSLIDRIEVSEETVAMDIGELRQVIALARGRDGMVLNPVFSWSSSNPDVATVVSGRITGHAQGTAVVTVSSEGRSAIVVVAVGPWTRQRLLTVEGSTLPRAVTIADSAAGGVQLLQYEVTDGMLRRGPSGRYQFVLFGRTSAGVRNIESMGVVLYNVFHNHFAFYPDGSDPNGDEPQFVAPAYPPAGLFQLHGPPTGTGPAVIMAFAGL